MSTDNQLEELVKQHTNFWPNKSNTSRGEKHGDCPKCGGDKDSDRFWISNGKGYCRQCNAGFESVAGFYAFIGQPNPSENGNSNSHKPIDKTDMDTIPDEPQPKNQTVKPKGRSFASIAEYAAYQGAPEAAFTNAGCTVVQHKNAPHIAFPCADGINRLRRMDQKAWYPQKSGATPQLYGWRRALQIRVQISDKDPLVLTNGQTSVIVAQHYGMAAFCLTDGENKQIPDSQLKTIKSELDKGITLYIAKDNDNAGEQGTKEVLTQLWQYGAQVKTIQFQGEPGYDLANHCDEGS